MGTTWRDGKILLWRRRIRDGLLRRLITDGQPRQVNGNLGTIKVWAGREPSGVMKQEHFPDGMNTLTSDNERLITLRKDFVLLWAVTDDDDVCM